MHVFVHVAFILLGTTIIASAAFPQRSFSTQSVMDMITQNQEAAWTRNNSKYVLYVPDSTGWGNQCRGLSASLILALLSGRRFLIDDKGRTKKMFFQNFDEPTNKFSIRSSNVTLPADEGPQDSLLQLGVAASTFEHNLDKALTSERLVLKHMCGGSFSSVFFKNKYQKRWNSVFDKDIELRWDEIEVVVMWWLFQNPSKIFLHSVHQMMDAVKWQSFDHHVIVQYRSFQDAKKLKSSLKLKFPELVSCVKTELQHLRTTVPTTSRILVYITSDDRAESERLRKSLGAVEPGMVLTVHEEFSNVHSALSARHNISISANQGLVDWYLLGMARNTVCSATSYCSSARTRTGIGRSSWSTDDVHSSAPFNDVTFSDALFTSSDGSSSNISGSGSDRLSAARGVSVICPSSGNFLHLKPPYSRAMSRPHHSVAWYLREETVVGHVGGKRHRAENEHTWK